MLVQIITTEYLVVNLYADSVWEACKEAHENGYTVLSATVLKP